MWNDASVATVIFALSSIYRQISLIYHRYIGDMWTIKMLFDPTVEILFAF